MRVIGGMLSLTCASKTLTPRARSCRTSSLASPRTNGPRKTSPIGRRRRWESPESSAGPSHGQDSRKGPSPSTTHGEPSATSSCSSAMPSWTPCQPSSSSSTTTLTTTSGTSSRSPFRKSTATTARTLTGSTKWTMTPSPSLATYASTSSQSKSRPRRKRARGYTSAARWILASTTTNVAGAGTTRAAVSTSGVRDTSSIASHSCA
mmetsp:Transcript_35953/g.69470  ORF Transcript_35953/g.69470 Transcript_35953/m.69470 type:complete len:206 (-) Transcript_35953:392-1009(-)